MTRSPARRSAIAAVLVFFGSEPAAWADWPYSNRVVQTSGNESPTAVAVRNWGPTGRVYIVVEMSDATVGTTKAELYRYLCYGGASCTPSLYNVGTWPKVVGGTVSGGITALYTAMAIQANGTGVEDVDVIRRDKVDLDCDDDTITAEAAEAALDLRNYDYHTDTNAVATRYLVSTNIGNSTNNACTDSGVSQLKNGAGALNACYTFKVNPLSATLDRIRCNDESGTVTFVWVNPVQLTSSVVEDHPAFDFKDGDRVVAGSRRPSTTSTDDEIRFHFPDAGGSPEPNFGIGLNNDVPGGIYPDMVGVSVTGGEVLYAVWEADGGKELRVGRCPATEDCQQATDWTVTTVHSTIDGVLRYPELATDGAFQMLVWEEDDDASTDDGERIYAMTRCGGTGTWSTPELIRTPDVSSEHPDREPAPCAQPK